MEEQLYQDLGRVLKDSGAHGVDAVRALARLAALACRHTGVPADAFAGLIAGEMACEEVLEREYREKTAREAFAAAHKRG